jgi:predicted ATPase
LARAHARLGQFDNARRSITQAITAFESSGERWWESEIYRVAGEIALMSPSHDFAEAEADIIRALSIAQKQQAKSWELRAATSMARLRREQDRRSDAGDVLGQVYNWFTEGFGTLDLKDAKALFKQLAQ